MRIYKRGTGYLIRRSRFGFTAPKSVSAGCLKRRAPRSPSSLQVSGARLGEEY